MPVAWRPAGAGRHSTASAPIGATYRVFSSWVGKGQHMAPRRRPRERGAAAVEFALILPLLMTVVIGVMEFGFLFNQQISLSQAAREGARSYAIHHGEAGFDLNLVVQQAAPSVSGVSASSSQPSGLCPSGQNVEITASKPYKSLTGWFNFLSWATISGKAAMRCGG